MNTTEPQMKLSHVALLLTGALLLVAAYLAMDNRTQLLLERQKSERLERELARTGGAAPAPVPFEPAPSPSPGSTPAPTPSPSPEAGNPGTTEDLKAELEALAKDRALINAEFSKTLGRETEPAPAIPVELTPRQNEIVAAEKVATVTEFNPATLGPKGSLFLTRPTLFDYLATREDLERRSGDVFGWIADGSLKLRLEHYYPLSEAVAAHQALEGRQTTGKVILTP